MDGMSKKADKSSAHLKDADADPQDAVNARERQRLIGRRLQTFFDDTIQEGVPDEFAKLLDRLDEAETERSTQGKSDAKSEQSGGSR